MRSRATHRAAGPASHRATPLAFEPRHCAGDSCLHNHAGASTPLVGQMRNHPRSAVVVPITRKPWERAS